jgi:hypothetical protein
MLFHLQLALLTGGMHGKFLFDALSDSVFSQTLSEDELLRKGSRPRFKLPFSVFGDRLAA